MSDWFYRLFINEAMPALQSRGMSTAKMVDLIEGDLVEVDIPDGCEKIRKYAFYGMTALQNVTLPDSITVVEDSSFESCASLAKVIFEGTPTELSSSAFSGCTSLLDIEVPWSEGEKAGAPWGASNATVHYDMGNNILGKAVLGRMKLA